MPQNIPKLIAGLHATKMEKAKQRRGGNDNRAFVAGTHLYLRAYEGDEGVRPIPSSQVFWLSPDIELYDETTGIKTPEANLQRGRAYRVEVTVHNSGDLPASACSVELFLSDFSAGLAAPAPLAAPQSLLVPAHGSGSVSFPFVSPSSGHRCLFARVHHLPTGDYPGCDAPGGELVTSLVDRTPTIRHLAQQNLAIVEQGEVLDLHVSLASANANRGLITFELGKSLPRVLAGVSTTQRLRLAPLSFIQTSALDALTVKARSLDLTPASATLRDAQRALQDRARPVTPPGVLRPLGVTPANIRVAAALPSTPPFVRAHAIAMKQGQSGDIQLGMPSLGLRRGEATVLHVRALDERGTPAGGATVIVKG